MDEVETMTAVGAKVGKAVGTGLHSARLSAIRAGHAGIDRAAQAVSLAEQKLAERGVSPEQLQQTLTDNVMAAKSEIGKTTRRTRKKLAKQTRMASKELVKRTTKARKQAKRMGSDLAAALEPEIRRRRRWPWIIGLLIAVAGAAYVVLSRRPREVELTEVEHDDLPVNGHHADRRGSNTH